MRLPGKKILRALQVPRSMGGRHRSPLHPTIGRGATSQYLFSLIGLASALVILVVPASVDAQTYVVKQGDTLGEIAESHGITVDEIVRANGIDNPDHVEPGLEITLSDAEGEVVKRGVVHIVRKGVTLRRISDAYEYPFRRLVKVNRIRNPDLIRRGARILIPGAKRVIPIATKRRPPCLREPVEIYRVHTGESREIVLAQCNGKVWEPGREEISTFLDRTRDKSAPRLNRRLLRMLQKVVERFPGRRIEVVSAFRPPEGERDGSRHAQAKALDFRVQGIHNARLRDFARSLAAVGVGYYPNSTFIHLDVREQRGFWVDWSGPGEPARYGSLAAGDPARRMAARRRNHPASKRRVARANRKRAGAMPGRSTSAAP